MSDVLDILTLAEAKRYLTVGASDTSKDTVLAAWITGASRLLDQCVGPVVQRTLTSESHDGGGCKIRLRWFPVATVTAVTEYQASTAVPLTAETISAPSTDQFMALPYRADPTLLSGELVRRSGGWDSYWYSGRANVLTTYTPGRYTLTTNVDARFKDAAGIILNNHWQIHQSSLGTVADYDVPRPVFPRFSIPNAVREMLADEWQAHDMGGSILVG